MSSVHRFVTNIARALAILGGAVLFGLIIMICVSIAGREINSFLYSEFATQRFPELAKSILDWGVGAIKGDFEIVEAGIAFCIFSFLPLTQISSAHASVSIFTNFLPGFLQKFLRALAEILFAAMLIIIAMQLFEGLERKFNRGQTTFQIEFPLWWAYALSFFGAFMAAAAGAYMAILRVYELFTGHEIAEPNSQGTESQTS